MYFTSNIRYYCTTKAWNKGLCIRAHNRTIEPYLVRECIPFTSNRLVNLGMAFMFIMEFLSWREYHICLSMGAHYRFINSSY